MSSASTSKGKKFYNEKLYFPYSSYAMLDHKAHLVNYKQVAVSINV